MNKKHAAAPENRVGIDVYISLALTAVILFFVASGFITYWNIKTLSTDAALVAETHETITTLEGVLSLLKDAETGQRGFVITGNDKYLEPYKNAEKTLGAQLDRLRFLTRSSPEAQAHIPIIEKHMQAKFAELEETINLRRTGGFEAARAVIANDRGKEEMDIVRDRVQQMEVSEKEVRQRRIEEMGEAYRTSISSGILAGLIGVLLSGVVAQLVRRAANLRRKEEWLQSGQVGLSNAIFGELRMEMLGENILSFLARYFNAQAAAFFVKFNGEFRRVAAYGVPEDSDTPKQFSLEHGMLGQAVKDARPFIISDVPEGYLSFGSALGRGRPRHLVIFPVMADKISNAVIEFGFLQPVPANIMELLENISETIGVAVRSAHYRNNLQNLLEETQRQSEELQSQSEELKVSNEELEEQSRALRESQTRLEQQQAELEQTNSQLEEQAQQLESQKDDLTRSKSAVQQKAQELEKASQYKSNFLANMSHELRTPLNSSLILAKLLADNAEGNLSDEQVRYAHTIQSSGNDLLTLINDILDLSKIEAGHMELRPEQMQLSRLTTDLSRMFDPIAKQRKLQFETDVAPNCPSAITTDRQRLEQVLKNLLSNAFKFTESGKVELSIRPTVNGDLMFSVTDTGIGISPEQQQAVFDAFRQEDGTISRKYGGTGLGLSISRELTRLLGGKIELVSEKGKGSTFSVTIPATFDASRVITPPAPNYATSAPAPAPTSYTQPRMNDDRENLKSNGRIILVVEDDESFASILYDLAHENDFQCLIANTAEDALIIARQYVPSAVLLDVGLPDNSGLSVLDRLKRDARTRHIPVHVVSANDYSQTAYSLGAIGYLMKPVKRDHLLEAFKAFSERLTHKMRRVLIVEDDDVQRESMKKLLKSHEVETVGVGTAAECLEKLKENTYDCMVLDLTLPDATGYSLLETLSQEEDYSFPPVIVYTGRDLSVDEEQRLRRYSKSIIIKGAKSPERLLDEVTLFLHQVVSELPMEQQKMLEKARNRDAILENRHILIVEDDVRNVYAVTSIFEPRGAKVHIARNGREALDMLEKFTNDPVNKIDLVLMDVMMPEMDGLTATRHIRKRAEWKKLPIIMLTAKAMRDDQEKCMDAGANDYMAKPLDVEKLLSLVRVWMPR